MYGLNGRDSVTVDTACHSQLLDLGEYGQYGDRSVEVLFPNSGDTIEAALTAVAVPGECADTVRFTVEVPALEEGITEEHAYLCGGQLIGENRWTEFMDSADFAPGVYYHADTSAAGCDSITVLHVEERVPDTVEWADTVCNGSMCVFMGDTLTDGGVYLHSVRSSEYECDSIIHRLTLTRIDYSLSVADSAEVCADDSLLIIPYELTGAEMTGCRVRFGEEAHGAGFTDGAVETEEGALALPIPEGVRPGSYDAAVEADVRGCVTEERRVRVDVLYPRAVVAQRWNDVLAIRNERYNGGYSFSAFEWYKNGVRMAGEDSPILYLPENDDFTAEYRARLTRADDGVRAFTCPVVRKRYAEEDIEVCPTVVFSGEEVRLVSAESGEARVINSAGQTVAAFDVSAGENGIAVPYSAGVYVLWVRYADGTCQDSCQELSRGRVGSGNLPRCCHHTLLL